MALDFWIWITGSGKRGTIRRASRRVSNGFVVMGACHALMDHARAESDHKDNPEGVFVTTIADLAYDYTTPPQVVREALDALRHTEWIRIKPSDPLTVGEEEDIRIRVTNYNAFNVARHSQTDKKRRQRRSFVANIDESPLPSEVEKNPRDLQEFVPTCPPESPVVPRCTPDRERDRERDTTPPNPPAYSNPPSKTSQIDPVGGLGNFIPDPEARANADIQRYRRDLGPLAMPVDELNDQLRERRGVAGTLPAVTSLKEIYEPCALLYRRYPEVFFDALAAAIKCNAPSKEWLSKACANRERDREHAATKGTTPTPSSSTPKPTGPRCENCDGLGWVLGNGFDTDTGVPCPECQKEGAAA